VKFSDNFEVYRVRQSATHPERHVRKAWYGRTWQAEWQDCVWCPRGYTRSGALRKARRWQKRSLERRLRMARRRHLARRYLTRRSDPYYKAAP
jgi:hypothetical protein